MYSNRFRLMNSHMKPLVYVTREVPAAGLNLLKSRKDLNVRVYSGNEAIPRKELLVGIKGASAVLSLLTDKIDDAALEAAGPNLKIVSNYAVGFDNIDLEACKKQKVSVTNTPGVLTDAVAEHAIGLMFAASRRIAEADRFTKAGKYKGWGPMMLLGAQLKGKTLGILGLGRIGRAVAERAHAGLGMELRYYDVKRDKAFEKKYGATYCTVDQLMKQSDVVSVHVPLFPSTRHLLNKKRLSSMKKGAILVNTSRGPIIDENALVTVLKSGRIYAALDVFEKEPKLSAGLARLQNVTLTPHIASATNEARDAMAIMAAQAILDVLDGKKPKNLLV